MRHRAWRPRPANSGRSRPSVFSQPNAMIRSLWRCAGHIDKRIETRCGDTDQEHCDIGQISGAARPAWRHVPRPDAYARKRLYDGVVYQLALRTVHELTKGDTAKLLRCVDLRCVVDGYDPATGHPGRLVLARLCVERERVNSIRLENVDPEVCFKSLGGKTNGRPSNLKPIEVLPESGMERVTA